jgi:FtsH-binding integral membrane protein
MTAEEKKMKSIWYLVGLMLLSMGALVFASGVYYYFNPNNVHTTLSHLHSSIWWGAIMVVAGLVFVVTQRNRLRD